MRPSRFQILEQDLVDALSKVNCAELNQRRGYVDMVLEEYEELENKEKANLSPVSYLNRELSEHTYFDLSLFNLVIAEILTNEIRENKEESSSDLVNCGIAAINNWKSYRDKHELEEKKRVREIQQRNRQTAKKLNKAKHGPLNALVDRIFELYEPTIFQLKRDGKAVTYFNVARRIEKEVRSLNIQPDGRYLLGNPIKTHNDDNKRKTPDPVGAIKRRLEKAVRDGDLKSIREYKKL